MKNVMKYTLWLLLLLPVMAFSQSVEGNWKMQIPDENGNMMSLKLAMTAGTYSVDFDIDGTPEVKGEYSIDGDQITIEDKDGPMACKGTKGIYKFTVTAESLSMTTVKDDCEGRGNPDGPMVFSRMK